MTKNLTICLSCVNGFLTYDFIKSLKNQKDFKAKIIGIDSGDSNKGDLICDKFYKVSSASNEKKYLKDIEKIYKQEKFDIFFPLSDIESFIILKYRNYLNKKSIKFKLPFNDFEKAKLFYDKKLFLDFCQENKIPSGKHFFVKNISEVKNIIKKTNAKYILKPTSGSGTKGVYLLNKFLKKKIKILESRNCYEINLKDLIYEDIFRKKKEFIMMPFYKGNIYDIDCIANNGKILHLSIRLREIKNRFMFYSTGHKIVYIKKIEKLITLFVKKLKLDGICDFDVIEKGKNNFILLEASCRFSGSVGVCTRAGVNFPSEMVRKILKLKQKKSKLNINSSYRSFLVFKKIDKSKSKILLNDYIPHYSKQSEY